MQILLDLPSDCFQYWMPMGEILKDCDAKFLKCTTTLSFTTVLIVGPWIPETDHLIFYLFNSKLLNIFVPKKQRFLRLYWPAHGGFDFVVVKVESVYSVYTALMYFWTPDANFLLGIIMLLLDIFAIQCNATEYNATLLIH